MLPAAILRRDSFSDQRRTLYFSCHGRHGVEGGIVPANLKGTYLRASGFESYLRRDDAADLIPRHDARNSDVFGPLEILEFEIVSPVCRDVAQHSAAQPTVDEVEGHIVAGDRIADSFQTGRCDTSLRIG